MESLETSRNRKHEKLNTNFMFIYRSSAHTETQHRSEVG